MALSFIFGGNTGETPESIKRKRDLARAIMGASNAPKNVGEGLNALGDGIVANVLERRASAGEKAGTDTANSLFQKIIGGSASASPSTASGGGQSSVGSGPAASGPINMSDNDVYSGFMDTVKTKITNPFGLAAVAATGKAESGFSPGNVNRTWSDPSESGKPGTAGGIMSWRGPRYDALAATGDLSPQGQAKFFLQENPQLIDALNNAKSVEEAQQLMNRAWAFAGYDRPGGEAANRLGYANSFLPQFQGQQQAPQEVASLDPSIGMPNTAAEAVTAMGQGGQPTAFSPQAAGGAGASVSATASPFLPSGVPLSEEAFDQRFGQTPLPGQQNVGPGALSAALTESNQAMANPSQISAQSSPFAPPTQQQPAPVEAAQAMPQQAVQQPPPEVDRRLYELIANPFASEEMKAVARMQLDQQMQAQQTFQNEQLWRQRQEYEQHAAQSDPSYQLGLKKTQAELDQMGKPEYRTLTREERQQYGIPDTDQRLYQVSRGGKVDAVGGAGQTINVGNEIDARKAAAEALGLSADDPRYQPFVLTGKFPREDTQALTATDKKALWAAEDEVPILDNTIASLEQAKSLNRKTYSGTGAGLLGTIGTNVPGAGLFLDRETAAATSEFNKLMSMEAIQSMAQTLKGATTDSELARFVSILADPSTDPDIRERTIDRMLALANRVKDVKANRINELRERDGAIPAAAGKKSTRTGGYTIEEE